MCDYYDEIFVRDFGLNRRTIYKLILYLDPSRSPEKTMVKHCNPEITWKKNLKYAFIVHGEENHDMIQPLFFSVSSGFSWWEIV